jgi:hypothetical protein
METIKKFVPIIVVTAIIIGIIYVLRNRGESVSMGYTAIQPQDDSARVAAGSQLEQAKLQVVAGGLASAFDHLNQKTVAAFQLEQKAYETEQVNILAKRDLQLAQVDSRNQTIQAQYATKQAKYAKQSQAISTIGTIALGLLMFCYDTTALARNNWIEYNPVGA